MVDGGRFVLRGAQRLLGVALIAVAFGLWLMPGSDFDHELLLFKLLLSIVAGLAGVGMLQSGTARLDPRVEIDTIRREVRLVRDTASDALQVIDRCAFDALAKVEIDGPHVRLWNASGVFMAEATLTDQQVLSRLATCLRASGQAV